MKHTIAILAIILAAGFAQAQPAPYPITINSRAPTAPPLTAFRASETLIRATFTDGSTASDLTNSTPFMAWSTNAYAATTATATVAVVSSTNGIVDFTFSPAAVNHAPGRYIYEVGVLVGGTPRIYRQGTFTIEGSPYAAGADPVSWTQIISWPLYTYTATATHGPVRPDDVTITAATNADGSITLTAIGAAATVITDATIDGDGTVATPLSITASLATKASTGTVAVIDGIIQAGTGSWYQAAADATSAYQPADPFDYAWITNPPTLFTPTDWATDYPTDYISYTNWTAKTDALYAWRTNSIPGSTNAIVDGVLTDIGATIQKADGALPASWTNATLARLGRDIMSSGATSVGEHGVALGQNASAGSAGIALGREAAGGFESVAIGTDVYNVAAASTAIGRYINGVNLSGGYAFGGKGSQATWAPVGAAMHFQSPSAFYFDGQEWIVNTEGWEINNSGLEGPIQFNTASFVVTGTVTAASFTGDGSALTGLPSGISAATVTNIAHTVSSNVLSQADSLPYAITHSGTATVSRVNGNSQAIAGTNTFALAIDAGDAATASIIYLAIEHAGAMSTYQTNNVTWSTAPTATNGMFSIVLESDLWRTNWFGSVEERP